MANHYDKRSIRAIGDTIIVADRRDAPRHALEVITPTDILDQLKAARDSGQTTNADVQRLLGLPSSRVAEIFGDKRRLQPHEAAKVAAHFGWTDKMPDEPAIRVATGDDDAIAVRQLDLTYAMGPGTNLDHYADETPVKYDPNFLRRVTRAEASALFVAFASGDSMFPTLINSDEVLIDTSQRVLNQQDRIWAVSVHGAGMIKRLRSIGKGRVRVLSDNETVPPEDVDVEDMHIVGRVIWIGRRV